MPVRGRVLRAVPFRFCGCQQGGGLLECWCWLSWRLKTPSTRVHPRRCWPAWLWQNVHKPSVRPHSGGNFLVPGAVRVAKLRAGVSPVVSFVVRRKQRRLASALRPTACWRGAQVRPSLFPAHLQEQIKGLPSRLESQRHLTQYLRQAKRLYHSPQSCGTGLSHTFTSWVMLK